MKIDADIELCFDCDSSDLAIKDELWEERLVICRKWIDDNGRHMSEEIALFTELNVYEESDE